MGRLNIDIPEESYISIRKEDYENLIEEHQRETSNLRDEVKKLKEESKIITIYLSYDKIKRIRDIEEDWYFRESEND